jgi:energy-coupling factor transporter ATP-binding protein EcfA2
MDSASTGKILEAFRTVCRSQGVTVVIVTHDRRISRAVDRVVAIRDGRTSSELIRRPVHAEDLRAAGALGDAGHADTHEEFAILDRAGRLQLPREHLDALGLAGKDRIRVRLDGKQIVLSPPDEDGKESP